MNSARNKYLSIDSYAGRYYHVKEFIYFADVDSRSISSRLSYFSRDSSRLIPDFDWKIRGNKVVIVSKRIERHPISVPADETMLNQLIKSMDRIIGFEMPHGDINRKNIVFDGKNFSLIDLEPVLEFNDENNRTYFRSTPPYIHPIDIESRRISVLTDLLGFGSVLGFLRGLTMNPRSIAPEVKDSIGLCYMIANNPFSRLSYILNAGNTRTASSLEDAAIDNRLCSARSPLSGPAL
jgi:hypothetical protein